MLKKRVIWGITVTNNGDEDGTRTIFGKILKLQTEIEIEVLFEAGTRIPLGGVSI